LQFAICNLHFSIPPARHNQPFSPESRVTPRECQRLLPLLLRFLRGLLFKQLIGTEGHEGHEVKKDDSGKIVEHVSNVLESLKNWHVENVPHVRFGLLLETSRMQAENALR
jgi:hypothetical protein